MPAGWASGPTRLDVAYHPNKNPGIPEALSPISAMIDNSPTVFIARHGRKFAGAKFMLLALCALLLLSGARVNAAQMRRPLSTTSPMWLIHVNYPTLQHPQSVIEAIPSDIRPYVVLNLAMSAAVQTGYETMDAWLNSAAQHGMYAMVQPSSGSDNSMSNTDITRYETLYQKYPNLIGFNFCEQSWGFDNATFPARLELFAKLLELGDKYGGYLYVNDTFSLSNSGWDTVAKFKTSQRFRDNSKAYKANFIYGNKYTHSFGYYDNESGSLGAYLSGHAGHYAVRFDQFAWGWSGKAQVFGPEYPGRAEFGASTLFSCPEAVAGVPIVEQMMLNGASVIDGPEIPEISSTYKGRATPMFTNMICDILRKALDGSIRIPALSEVASRTKIALVALASNNPPADLYTGLYEMDGQQSLNRTWFKKTGQYPTIPVIFTNDAYETSFLSTYVTDGNYTTRWPTQDAKVNEFNGLFAPQSTGDLFVARVGNKLLTYNPYINTDVAASASIPLKYNTASQIDLTCSAHTFGVITESDQSISVYLNNYRMDRSAMWATYPNGVGMNTPEFDSVSQSSINNPTDTLLRESVLQISGCTAEPTSTVVDRGSHRPSNSTGTWANGVYTLQISHNGPVDITISCAGAATDRLPVPAPVSITQPAPLPAYNVAPFQLVRSVGFSIGNGVAQEVCSEGGLDVGSISNGDWVLMRRVDFGTGANSFIARVTGTAGGAIELRLDNELGPLVGTCTVPPTGGTQLWATASCAVDSAAAQGVHDLYLRFTGGAGSNLFAINWFQFGSPSTPLTAPTDLGGFPNPPDQAVLSWTGSIDAAGYNVKRAFNSGGPYTTIATNVPNPTYTDAGLNMGLTYYYVVSKVNATQESPNSTEASVKMARVLFPVADAHVRDGGSATTNFGTAATLEIKLDPTANSGLSRETYLRFDVTGLANVASAQLRWTPVSVGTTVSQINYDFVPTDTWTESGITWNTKPASTTSLGSLTGYTAKVPVRINVLNQTRTEAAGDAQLSIRAYSAISGSSRFVFFAAKEAANIADRPCIEYLLAGPPKPTGLTANASLQQVALSWNPSAGASSYLVKRSFNSGGPYKLVGIGLTSPQFTDEGLIPDRPVFYVVSAVGAENQSDDSAELALVTGSPTPRVFLRLDETTGTTASDSSGNGWTGTLVNGPVWVSGTDAKINGALKLDGVNDHVTLPSGVVSTLNDFTISFWTKLTSIGTFARVFDFNVGNANTTMYLTPRATSTAGPVRFAIKVNGASQNLEGTSALPTNVWTHVAVTLSGTTAKLWVNGNVVGTNNAMTFKPSSLGITSVNYLGRSPSTSDPYLNGTIDEFKIFGRALLPSEITTLANPPPPPAITSATSASAQYGTDFNYAIAATQSPSSFSATGLPPGLSLDGATGIISGRPAALGNFSVTLQASNSGGTGTATLALAVSPAPATISLDGLARVYDGSPKAVTAIAQPAGVPVVITYDGNPNPPTNAGTYQVMATSADPNYIGGATGTLMIAPASATVSLIALAQVYDGTAKSAMATTTPEGLSLTLAYDGADTPPVNAGTYHVTATITDSNYVGSAIDTLVVAPAPAAISLGSLTHVYDGTEKQASVSTSPAGLGLVVTYNGAATLPVNAGDYSVVAIVTDLNYAGSASGTLRISKATATIELSPLTQRYDGIQKTVTATTAPSGLNVDIVYDDSSAAPIYPGSYSVTATIVDDNYIGSLDTTLTIGITALVRHAPTLNGIVDGSVQMLTGESVALNSHSSVSGDLLVPGIPTVQFNGQPQLVGQKSGQGAAAPSGYVVTLNRGAVLRYLVSQVDPIAMPTVAAPLAPNGTRSVAVNNPSTVVGDFATVRNLTLNGGAGNVAVPAGAYGAFTVNQGSSLTLGVPGSTEPTVYDIQSLQLNSGAQIRIVGPVILTVANSVTVNGSNVGNASHLEWLVLRVYAGGLTLNNSSTMHGTIIAPAGSVAINGNAVVRGTITADRLTINGNGLLDDTP